MQGEGPVAQCLQQVQTVVANLGNFGRVQRANTVTKDAVIELLRNILEHHRIVSVDLYQQ